MGIAQEGVVGLVLMGVSAGIIAAAYLCLVRVMPSERARAKAEARKRARRD